MANSIKKWHEVYIGDKECKFFKALARHKEHRWRSAKAISADTKLSIAEVEEIIEKYLQTGQVKQQNDNPELFAYFERIETKPAKQSIGDTNKTKRIEEDSKKAP